jgi:hypothetical protein
MHMLKLHPVLERTMGQIAGLQLERLLLKQ